jgi:hypothetical protein
MERLLRHWVFLGVFLVLALALAPPVRAADFRLEEVPSAVAVPVVRLKPGVVVFSDHHGDELADGAFGLIKFEDWTRERPVQKRILSLFPGYAEPAITVTVNGLSKRYVEKLHVYLAEARFVLRKPPGSLDLSRYANLAFLEKVDPAIKHRTIAPGQAIPNSDPDYAYNRPPDRAWCAGAGSLCIESRYQLEGKLPTGIRLANKIEDSAKKIADYLQFQSELRVLSPQDAAQAGLAELTGLSSPFVGTIEQSLFHVNQIIQSGKLLAILQEDPTDAGRTVATVFLMLAVETDVLSKKKEFEAVPVLRNLVPAQVLMGNSSFNTGQSLSAGLPAYARNHIKAIASILESN